MILRQIYKFLSSAKLAIALLISILACCLLGVTVWRAAEAGRVIFGTLWFNGLLVLLVVNVACCFFPRMWGRKLTLTSFGMVLFHLSFVAMLGGIVYNSLFYFMGMIRLTEGETISNGELQNYDAINKGRYFDLSKLKGETTLIKMHSGYRVGREDKRAAYEIAVGEGSSKKRGVIYITESLEHRGFRYLNDREGYSVLIILYDNQGRELYGAHVPLQSLKQKNGAYLYTTGTKEGPESFPFPQDPMKPLFVLQTVYRPSKLKERGGEAFFQVRPLSEAPPSKGDKPTAEGKAAIGDKVKVGDYSLSVKEVRYWVAMTVRYDPGKPIVLTSLWVALGGLVLTFIGRMMKKKQSAVSH